MKVICLSFGLIFFGLSAACRCNDVEQPETDAYNVPYRLTDVQHLLVRAKINGKGPFNFIVDTGAPALFVATEICQKLGIKPGKDGWGRFEHFEIEGGLRLPNLVGRVETPFQLEGMNGLGLSGVPLHGIIGYTVLAQFRIEIDLTKDKMRWTRLNFRPPSPQGLGPNAKAPASLNALGSIMKLMGFLLGKKPELDFQYRGFLGIELADNAGELTVKAVLPHSPADKSGIKKDDRISHWFTKPVHSIKEILKLSAAIKAGEMADLTIVRNSEKKQIKVKLTSGL